MALKPATEAAMAGNGSIVTQARAVYEQLRSDIMHGVLEPGAKLKVEAICARYKVGASPLREALSMLSAQGLVDRADQRGFSVAQLKWDELPVLNRSRLQIEGLALRESIEKRDSAWEEQLALLVHRLSRTPRSLSAEKFKSNPDWDALHAAFHRALLSKCESRWIRDFCDELGEEFYRFREVAAGTSYGRRDAHAEHVALFEAAIDGRADEAVRLLSEHYTQTSELIADLARKRVKAGQGA